MKLTPQEALESRDGMKAYISQFTGFPKDNTLNPADFGIQDPRTQYGLADADIHYFKYHDIELKEAIDKFTGIDFPLHKIDDFLIVEFAGMVQKLGVDGAVAEAKKMPRRLRALYRAVARNHRTGRI